MCNSLHWTDPEAALRSIATSLRPGGTFAACLSGFRINFPQDDGLTRLWVAATTAMFGQLFDDGHIPPPVVAGMSKALNGYDNVAVDEALYTNVRRVSLNAMDGDPEPFRFADTTKFKPRPSRVKQSETVEYARDRNWSRQVDVDWLKGHLRTTSLPFDDKMWALPAWKEFEAAVAGHKDPLTAEWACSVLLATRK